MQTNEFAGQVHQGPRLPHVEQALTETRVTPENRADRVGADERRHPAARLPARKPRRYGAGF